ncbi:MAG: hypothetical protein AAE975_03920 [Thermoplasmatales archaeon]
MPSEEAVLSLVNESVKESVRRGRWKYAKPPLYILIAMLVSTFIYYSVFGIGTFFTVMPDILFISAVVVMFFGAWYDFGAESYIKDLKDFYRKSITEADLVYINKQQLIMTLIYILIGFLYIGSGVAIYLLSSFIG